MLSERWLGAACALCLSAVSTWAWSEVRWLCNGPGRVKGPTQITHMLLLGSPAAGCLRTVFGCRCGVLGRRPGGDEKVIACLICAMIVSPAIAHDHSLFAILGLCVPAESSSGMLYIPWGSLQFRLVW
jgi:hypothetical protein